MSTQIPTTCVDCGERGATETDNRAVIHKTERCRKCEKVKVHIYTHPNFDMPLVIEASDNSRTLAAEFLGDGKVIPRDEHLLTMKESEMTVRELENLPDWDG